VSADQLMKLHSRKDEASITVVDAMRWAIPALIMLATLFAASGVVKQQSSAQFMKEGVVSRNGDVATVKANDPRPLAQAIQAVSEEYGWVVDYEDPVYSDSDLIDATNPEWRASHPDAPGVKGIRGGAFQCDYDEPSAFASIAGEAMTLEKIVSEYNRSGNSGKFILRDEGEVYLNPSFPGFKSLTIHRFSIVGSFGILDTPVSIPTEKRSAQATIDLILKQLSSKSRMKVFDGGAANNLLMNSEVTVGGENVPARDLVIQTLNATQRPQYWRFLYDPGARIYALNIHTVARLVRDANGNKHLEWIDLPPIRRP
jgi:hypothetical protein